MESPIALSKVAAAISTQYASTKSQLWLDFSRGVASSSALQQAEAALATEDAATTPTPPDTIPMYTVIDRVSSTYQVQRKRVFAVVEVGGTQFKITPDDVIVTEKLRGVDVNDKLRLSRVLLLGSEDETIIGRPFVPQAHVIAAVEEQFLDGKVLIFKKRRRKNSRRLKGHRQPLTTLRILDVHGIEEAAGAAPLPPA